MTPSDDQEGMGDRSHLRFGAKGVLDDETVDALLDGRSPQDAPPGYADVARLLAMAAGPPSADELAGEDEALAAFAAARSGIRPISQARRRRYPTRLAAASLLGGLVLTGGVAAAATGSLPSAVQSAVSHALDTVGISVPSGRHGSPDHGSQGTGVDNGVGNNGTNMGGAGNHSGVSNLTHTTGTDNGGGNNGTNQGGNGNHTGVSQVTGPKTATGTGSHSEATDHTTPTTHSTAPEDSSHTPSHP